MKKEKQMEKFFEFSPEDITLKDDAYHGSKAFIFTEWWYFDAELNDGYSIQMHLRVGSLLKSMVVIFFQKIDLYKDKKLITSKRNMFLKKHVIVSKDKPYVKINGKEVINGYLDPKNGKWVYDLNFEIGDIAAYMKFVGDGRGYKGIVGKPMNKKGSTKQGGWAVILPFAKVSGKLRIGDKTINVNGFGYHDHNWDMKGTVITNYGWFWGKIYLKNYAIVWSKVFKTKMIGSSLLIISKKNDGYINVKSNDIKLTMNNYKKEKSRSIPYHLSLSINNDKISLDIDMNAKGVHHTRSMGFVNYYRYHMDCKGSVTIDSDKEIIDDILICEFMRFG
jgi:predicted secreted hydrolase